MKEIRFILSEKLYEKLIQIKNEISINEKTNVIIDDIIEEALMSYYNITIVDINDISHDYDKDIANAINTNNMMNQYYVYAYYDLDKKINRNINGFLFEYEPFYIGKGKDNRIYDLNHRDRNLLDHINLLKEKNKVKMEKIIINLNETDACLYERIFINNFGRISNGLGVLYNKSKGNGMHKKPVNELNYNLNLKYYLITKIVDILNKEKNKKIVAKMLNISERTLYRHLKKYSITKDKKTKIWKVDKE
jgi:hypothetical protein